MTDATAKEDTALLGDVEKNDSPAEPEKMLGEDSPMLVYSLYLGTIAALCAVAFGGFVDLEPLVPVFSKIVLVMQAMVGFVFLAFGYCYNPNLLCYAANFFTYFESMLLGREFQMFTLQDSYDMFQGAIDSVKDPVKNNVARNFMFAITIKLRVECCFWMTTSFACIYALTCPLAERKILHLLCAMMGTCAMTCDFNHVNLFPFNFLGDNHFVNNIGRFIGYAFGATFVFVNFMSYTVLYYIM